MWIYHIFFIVSSIDRHLGHYQFLAIVSTATMNIVDKVSLLEDEMTLVCMPKSGVAGS